MHRICLALAGMLVLGLPVQAQSAGKEAVKKTVIKYWNKIHEPKAYLDSERVYQPGRFWSVQAGYEMRSVGTSVRSENVQFQNQPYDFTLEQRLKDRAAHEVGLKIGYGGISLGLSHEVGRKEGASKSISLAYENTFWGASFRYSRYSSLVEGFMDLKIPGSTNIDAHTPFLSTEPGEMVNVIVDGYYAFNRKKFSYTAAFDGKTLQRKSTGSWIVGAKYMQGGFTVNPKDDVILSVSQGIGKYSTYQFSLGGGYSFNWVLFHRDPETSRDLARLSNLTINLTAMPMLTVFNRTETARYKQTESFVYTDENAVKVAMMGNIQPNFIARAALNWTAGHFFLNLWTDYCVFRFYNEKRSFNTGSDMLSEMAQSGKFTHFRVNFSLSYRF